MVIYIKSQEVCPVIRNGGLHGTRTHRRCAPLKGTAHASPVPRSKGLITLFPFGLTPWLEAQIGGSDGTRTHNILIKSQLLYQLSYETKLRYFYHNTSDLQFVAELRVLLVDLRGVEPRPMQCHRSVLPLSLQAQNHNCTMLTYVLRLNNGAPDRSRTCGLFLRRESL